jgi:microcystin-dependent protein
MSGYLTPDAIGNSEVLRFVLISQNLNLLGALTNAIDMLAQPSAWQQFGTLTPDEVAQYFFDVAWKEREMSLAGVILPYVGVDCPSFALPCDGATYNRVDYPVLYAAIETAFIVDADTFTVPDLSGRVPVGQGGGHSVADVGGEESHTLVLSESPSHSHSDTGHTHTEITATPIAVTIGAGAPVPSAVPGVGVTGVGNASLTSAGGDGAHNNMQPYLTVKFCIVFG